MMKYADAYEKIIRQILHEEKDTAVTSIPLPQRRDFATYDFRQRHEAVLKTIQEKKPAVLLIGNSITHFWGGKPEAGINHGINSWKKYFEPLNTLNLGFGWDRIENVLWRVHHGELDGYAAKKIVLTIGTNNLSIGNSDDEILKGLQHLLKAIQQRQPSATVFLSGIYPRRDMEPRITALNKKIALLAKKMTIAFIDPGRLLLKFDMKIDESLFSDGLHPNEEGYEKLGAALNRLLTDI
jgi:lysophospholipase L1-like esterase